MKAIMIVFQGKGKYMDDHAVEDVNCKCCIIPKWQSILLATARLSVGLA